MFHYSNKQCSIDSTIPRKLLSEDKLIRILFKKKVFLLFGENADAVITKYEVSSRCRFHVLFDKAVEDTEYYEELVRQLVRWTITEVEAEYDRKASKDMGTKIINDFNNYKKLHSVC